MWLVLTGSFSPPQKCHILAGLNAAKDVAASTAAVPKRVIFSPVNQGYEKPGLLPPRMRLDMVDTISNAVRAEVLGSATSSAALKEAVRGLEFVGADRWEPDQPGFVETGDVCAHFKREAEQRGARLALVGGLDFFAYMLPVKTSVEIAKIWTSVSVRRIVRNVATIVVVRRGDGETPQEKVALDGEAFRRALLKKANHELGGDAPLSHDEVPNVVYTEAVGDASSTRCRQAMDGDVSQWNLPVLHDSVGEGVTETLRENADVVQETLSKMAALRKKMLSRDAK